MNLYRRYRMLSFWNKFGFWAGVASIVAIPLSVAPILLLDPVASRAAEPVELPVHEPGVDLSPPDRQVSSASVQLLALYADSVVPALKTEVTRTAWSAATALQVNEGWRGRATYCVEPPKGRRIVAVQLRVESVVGETDDVSQLFRLVESSPQRVCYEVHADAIRLPTCTTPCSVADPVVKWRASVRLEDAA